MVCQKNFDGICVCVCMYILTLDHNFITYQDVILKTYHEAA